MVRLTAPVKQARPGPPLAPILGQHQVKVVDFIAEFNRQTPGWVEGLPVGCRLYRLPGVGRFTLRVAPPSYTTLLFSLADASPGRIDPAGLFAALTLRNGGLPPGPAQARTALGTLRSCRLRLE